MADEPTTTASTPKAVRDLEIEAMGLYRAKFPEGIPWQELDSSTRIVWVTHAESSAAKRKMEAAMADCLTLPPLPEPARAWITVVNTAQGPSSQINWTRMTGTAHHPLFTADQLRSYAAEVWRCAMEAAAQAARERAEDVRKSNTYRGRVNQAAQFAADQLEFAADVLRSLPVPQQEKPE